METSTAAVMLREFGIDYAAIAKFSRPFPNFPAAATAPPDISGPLSQAAADLTVLVKTIGNSPRSGGKRLKRTGWTRQEALGHLIDWAAAHQQWFARALTEPKLTASGYPDDGWLSAQHNDLPWQELLDLCVSFNRLIVHIVRIPEEKMDTPCRIGIADPIPLQELVRRYVAHCEDIWRNF